MHTFILLLKHIDDRLNWSDSFIHKPEDFIQQQKITLSGSNYLPCKIKAVENIGSLFCLFLLTQVIIAGVHFFETENLEIKIIQILKKIQFSAFPALEKLYDDHTFSLRGKAQSLADSQCRLSFPVPAINLCYFFFHDSSSYCLVKPVIPHFFNFSYITADWLEMQVLP